MSNVLLHVHDAADLGSVCFSICDLIEAFPQFHHVALHLNPAENREAIKMLNGCGVRTFHGTIQPKVIEELDPRVIIFHDTCGDAIKSGGQNAKWIRRWPTISWHYSIVKPMVFGDVHIFSSENLVNKNYKGLLDSGHIKRWNVIPSRAEIVRGILSEHVVETLLMPVDIGSWETAKRGVVVGSDEKQEWMLEWWWKNYSKHNTYPVLFVDMGMSAKANAWCKERGLVKRLDCALSGWFQKPFAMSQTVFEESIWTDVDCEIRGSIDPVFAYCAKGFSVAKDRYTPFGTTEEPVNSGVVAYQRNSKILPLWCAAVVAECKKFRGDQEILEVVKKTHPGLVSVLPNRFNWLRLAGDNPDAVIIHWTGPEGKKIIKAQIEEAARA